MIDLICQIGIFIFGPIGIYILSVKKPWMRWGYIIGFISQPFWLISTIRSEQWGMVFVCVIYTYSYLQGIWNYWLPFYYSFEMKHNLKRFFLWLSGKKICPLCGGAGEYFSEGMARDHTITRGVKCDSCDGKGIKKR